MSAAAGPTRARAALWLAVGTCAAACFWIANGVAPWDGDRMNAWHQYEYLAEGFLHGHSSLSVAPDPALLKLKDPYDPRQNGPYRMWDASLYEGRFYLYQGPVPALVLMLPWRALTGHALPQRLAVAIFAAGGLAGLALLLHEVRRRHFPRLSALALGCIVVVAFHASWLPVTLRRSALWELPVVSAAACLWWSLYFLWKFHDSGGRRCWALATGAALALLMGCRVACLFGAGAVALALFARGEVSGKRSARPWRAALAGAAVSAAGGVALLAYNHARFGSWFDFGLSHTLFGEDYRGIRFSSLSFIPFNLRTYLFSLPAFGPYFPFLHPFWSDATPPGFVGFEEMYGVLFMMPVHLAGLVAFGWSQRNRSLPGMRAVRITLGAGCLATLGSAVILFTWAWACSRFINELMAGWLVATCIGMMVIFGSEDCARPPKTARMLTIAASIWTIGCTWLASAEFRGFMRQTNPATYTAFAHALDYPSLWWERARKADAYGPRKLEVRVAPTSAGADTVLLANGRPQRVNQLIIDRGSDGLQRFLLVQNDHVVLATPRIPAPGGRVLLWVTAPWLYPPPEHPYWDSIRDPAVRVEAQRSFALRWDDAGSVRTESTHSVDATQFEPSVRLGPRAGEEEPYVERIGMGEP